MQHDAHMTQTHNIYKMRPTYFQSTNTSNYMHHKSGKKAQHPLHKPPSTTPTTQQTSKQTHQTITDTNVKTMHSSIVTRYLSKRDINKTLHTHPLNINTTEETLPRNTRRTLSQLRAINPLSSNHIYTSRHKQYYASRHKQTHITTLSPM